MRNGVRLGVDVGEVRIGVARSDPHGMLASPVEVVRAGSGDVERLRQLVAEHEPIEVLVGLPIGLRGVEGAAAEKARAFAKRLYSALLVPVRLVDERFSTVSAHQAYRSQGQSTRQTRERVDAAAAAVFLQSALDTERNTGRPPGEEVGLS